MTHQLHDDELYSLIRRALPEVDVDTLSPTGTQARAVFDRGIAGDRTTELDSHSFVDKDAAVRLRLHSRRRAFIVPITVVAAAATARPCGGPSRRR